MEAKPLTELNRVRQWAHDKIQAGSEPPWAWYQYMKLIEAIDAIKDGMAATTTENSPQSETHSERRLQLVDSTSRKDTSPRRLVGSKVRMPM
jgi:hypothetical protein